MLSRKRFLWVATLAAVLPIIAPTSIYADGFKLDGTKHISISPHSIPVTASGATSIGIARLEFRNADNFDPATSISSVTLELLGTIAGAKISKVWVYYEPKDGNTLFDHGTPIDDVLVGSLDSPFSSGSTAIVPISTSFSFGWPGSKYLYAVFDFAAAQSTGTDLTAGVRFINIVYGPAGNGTGGSMNPNAELALTTTRPVDDYRATLEATGIAPSSREQGSQKVPVLKLVYDTADTTLTEDLDSITLVKDPSATMVDSDIMSGGVILYEDTNTNGTFEPAIDQPIAGAGNSMSGGTVTLNPTGSVQFTSASRTVFVAVNVSETAVVGRTIGLRVANPSTAHVFIDTFDDVNPVSPNYAYVPSTPNRPYDQSGYLTETSATPTSGNLFTVDLYVPFIVTEITPANGASGVPRESNVTAKFTEDVDFDPLEYGVTFYLKDSGAATVPASASYNGGTRTITIDPTANLDWGETYTATMTTGVLNSLGEPLEEQKQWVFTVEPEEHPYVAGTAPLDDEMNISKKNPGIEAVFSERVQNVTATTFLVEEAVSGTAVAGAVAEKAGSNGTIWTFTPGANLKASMEYQVTILGTGPDFAKDMDDLALVATSGSTTPADKVWTFWTASDVPPAVVATAPADGATGVPIASTISAVFSKPILESTLAGHFQVRDSSNEPVAGTLSYDSDTLTATFAPTAPLKYNRAYTVTITTDITDEDTVPMLQPKTWSFRTFGEFPEPIAAKNRIQPGVNESAFIFIPEPPASAGGADARVTVQVFTATGRRVATLRNAVRYSDLVDELPLEWLGTNSQGDPLGPGLYFIRISATGWVRTLKVMVVR